jgi:hypothetical protein
MNRRSFLIGLGLVAAPAIIRPGILMPIRAQPLVDNGRFGIESITWIEDASFFGNTIVRFDPPVWIGAYIENGDEDICAEIRGDRWERHDGVWKRLPGLPPQSS